jgi:aspartyl/asparaginyl beta-hydroxylase (cupin superfamily)
MKALPAPLEAAPPPWFADERSIYVGSEPHYFENAAFAWVAELEGQWQIIRDELLAFMGAGAEGMQPYQGAELMSRPKSWKTLGLMFWCLRSERHCARFPQTWALLQRIPNLTAASFNLLEPRATIKPHIGNTNAIVRCHLGLVIPQAAPACGFRVGGETRSWQEGRLLMFCDAYEHTAWNNTDLPRYVMVLDVMRPAYAHQRRGVCARVLAALRLEAWAGGSRRAARLLRQRWLYRSALQLLRLHFLWRVWRGTD